MKGKTTSKTKGRISRHKRIRSRIKGTAERPRISIYKSNRYIHAQLVDDEAGKTLLSFSTKEFAKGTKTNASKLLGAELAKQAKAVGIVKAVFDRGGFRFTGRVAAVASGAREGGLVF